MWELRFSVCAFLLTGSFGFLSATAHAEKLLAKIHAGEKWAYQQTDNITKSSDPAFTVVATEVTDQSVTLAFQVDNNRALTVFDYNGNELQDGGNKYSPNDGMGIPEDAKPGTTWKQAYTWRNTEKNRGGKATVNGTCDVNEQVTVPAGTMDTLKCHINSLAKLSVGGEKQVDTTLWLSPQTLLPVKREVVTKRRGHLESDVIQELAEYHLN